VKGETGKMKLERSKHINSTISSHISNLIFPVSKFFWDLKFGIWNFVLVVFLFFALLPLPTAKAASDASFQIVGPGSVNSYVQGCSYTADIRINAGSNTSNAADVIVQYDPAKLQILDANPNINGVQIFQGNAFETYLGNLVDQNSGTIRLTGASSGRLLQGSAIFGSIRFLAKSGVTNASLSIKYDGLNNTRDSNIAIYQTSLDALASVDNLTMNFVSGNCFGDSASPDITFINPKNNQNYVSTDAVVEFELKDNMSGIDISSIEILVNGALFSYNSPEVSITGSPNNYLIKVSQKNRIFTNSPSAIYVRATDYAGNSKASSIAFNFNNSGTTETSPEIKTDLISPKIEFISPVSRQTIKSDEIIKFRVTDNESGVDISSLQVFVNETKYVHTDTAFKFQNLNNGFDVELKDTFTFPKDNSSVLFIFIADKAKNNFLDTIFFNIPDGGKAVPVENIIPAPLKDDFNNIANGVDKTQQQVEDAAPKPVKPVVREVGFLGLASLAFAIPYLIWLIPLLISFVAGGFFFPFLRDFFIARRKKLHALIVEDSTRQSVKWAKVIIYNVDRTEVIKKYVSDWKGRWYAKLPAGTYSVEMIKKGYQTRISEITLEERGNVKNTFTMILDDSQDIYNKLQFGLLSFDPKIFIIYFPLVLSFLNLVFTQTITSLFIFGILILGAFIYRRKSFVQQRSSD
jgi:hypothetical protein